MKTYEDLFNASEEEKRELTDEEVQQVGVRVAAEKMRREGYKSFELVSSASDQSVLRFKSGDDASFFVITTARYPSAALPPENVSALFNQYGSKGFWVGITLAHELEAFDPESDEGMRLMKGFGLIPRVREPLRLGDRSRIH